MSTTSSEEFLVHLLDVSSREVDAARRYFSRDGAWIEDLEGNPRAGWMSYGMMLGRSTVMVALGNALYGRSEYFAASVVDRLDKEPGLAHLWNPDHVFPILDFLRREVVSPILHAWAEGEPPAVALLILEDAFRRPDFVSLVTESESFILEWDARFGVGDLTTIEREAFPALARGAVAMLLRRLIEDGVLEALMDPDSPRVMDCFCARAAQALVNSKAYVAADGGRALVLALVGLALRMLDTPLSRPAIPDEAWVDTSTRDWAGKTVDGLRASVLDLVELWAVHEWLGKNPPMAPPPMSAEAAISIAH